MSGRGLFRLVGAAILALSAGLPGVAAAGNLQTTIDLAYTYEQVHLDQEVTASSTFGQKYEVKYAAELSSAFDLLGAVKLEVENKWASRTAETSHIAPSLELDIKGAQSAFKASYQSAQDTTDTFQETAEITTYAYKMMTELQVTDPHWPEVKLRLDRNRDFQLQSSDGTTYGAELQAKKDIFGLRLELNVKKSLDDQIIPEEARAEQTDWSVKATYKDVLYGGTEFELAYEIKETYGESSTRGVPTTPENTFAQTLKTRFKNSLVLTPRLTVGLSWEYQYDQDLIFVELYSLKNQYKIDMRYDLLSWVKLTSELNRASEFTALSDPSVKLEQKLTDTLKAAVDLEPVTWLRLSSKAELKRDQSLLYVDADTLDEVEEEKYESVLKNKFGDFWDLTVNYASSTQHTDGWRTATEGKFKADLRLKFLTDFMVEPVYEMTRSTDWDVDVEGFTAQEQVSESKIRFEYKRQFVDLLGLTFSHEYGVKQEDSLDGVRSFERVVSLNENTRLNLTVSNLFEDMKLEGQVERKASDTEGDPDPMLVDVSYSLKFDWKVSVISLSSSLTYDDKGDTFDNLTFNTKVDWKMDLMDLSGEYQYSKVYSDEIDETRKLNLKFSMRF